MFLDKLVQQHRVHRVVAHGIGAAVGGMSHQIRVHLFHFFSHQAELCRPRRVSLFAVVERDRFKRKDRFAGFIHWLDLVLDRKSTRLNSSHLSISYAVFCLKKKKKNNKTIFRLKKKKKKIT